MAKQPTLIRYISPFGSPAWMTREKAQGYLHQDFALWSEMDRAGVLSADQREVGAPRIEVPR